MARVSPIHIEFYEGMARKSMPAPRVAVSAEIRQLIEGAKERGARVTPKQIARWRTEKALPHAQAQGRGRALGVGRPATDATLDQLVSLVGLLHKHRSLDYAIFRLWLRGFDIPIQRLRSALDKLVFKTFEKYAVLDPESLNSLVSDAEIRAADRRNVPKRTRVVARRGELAPALLTALQLFEDKGNVSERDGIALANAFTNLGALDKAKTGAPSLGISGWLNGDPVNEIRDSFPLFQAFGAARSSLTDDDLIKMRPLYVKFEGFMIFAQLVQRAAKDNEALGLSLLTRGPFGGSIETNSPTFFVALATLLRAKPEFEKNLVAIVDSVDMVLQKAREVGIAVPVY